MNNIKRFKDLDVDSVNEYNFNPNSDYDKKIHMLELKMLSIRNVYMKKMNDATGYSFEHVLTVEFVTNLEELSSHVVAIETIIKTEEEHLLDIDSKEPRYMDVSAAANKIQTTYTNIENMLESARKVSEALAILGEEFRNLKRIKI